jgi:hypothetical protein
MWLVITRQLLQKKVDAVGGVQGERDMVGSSADAQEAEHRGACGGDLLVDAFSPRVLHPSAARVVGLVVVGECVDDRGRSQALASRVEVDVRGAEVGEVGEAVVAR